MSDNKDKKIADIFKKVVSTGVTAAFMTEDAVKGIISELSLPKDIAQGLVNNAKNTKDEFITSIKSELKGYLNKVDLSKEIDKVLENYNFEVNATIKLKRKSKEESQDES